MRYVKLWIAVGALILLGASPAHAVGIAYSGFNNANDTNYPPGQDIGSWGWNSTSWTLNTAKGASIVPVAKANQLSYSPGGGWSVAGDGSALKVSGLGSTDPNNENLATRQLTSLQADGLGINQGLWTSFLIRWDAGEVNTNEQVMFWFDNNLTSHTSAPDIGIYADHDTRGDFVVRIKASGNNNMIDYAGTIAVDPTQTHFVVGHLFKTGDNYTEVNALDENGHKIPDGHGGWVKIRTYYYDGFEMWVDPTLANRVGDRSASPTVYAYSEWANTSESGLLSAFDYVGVRTAGLDACNPEEHDIVSVDEFRLGSSMFDVVDGGGGGEPPVVPEPLTLLGVFGGVGALLEYLRRRAAA